MDLSSLQLHRLGIKRDRRASRVPAGQSRCSLSLQAMMPLYTQAVYSLEGSETAGQVAEEAVRAEFLAPLAVVGSIVGAWIIGLAYMLALLFSVQSISNIQATSFALPIAQLYYDAVGRRLTLMCLTCICFGREAVCKLHSSFLNWPCLFSPIFCCGHSLHCVVTFILRFG